MRPELIVTEIAAPGTLAPWSFALAADVAPARHGSDSELGTGRFVLLYDPSAPDAWNGTFRVICYAQAPLETEMGVDPFLADVAWSWLVDALDGRGRTILGRIGHRNANLVVGLRRTRKRKAMEPKSNFERRGLPRAATSPLTSKPGANCCACSRGCLRRSRE